VKPICLAQFDERPRIVCLPGGVLWGIHVRTKGETQQVVTLASSDGGTTWGDPEALLDLPMEPGTTNGAMPLVDSAGEVHLFLMNDRGTGVFGDRPSDGKPKSRPMHDRRIDIWHCRSEGQRTSWTTPRRIWKGYTGSINSAIQMRSGRIVLPFAFQTGRVWQDRGEGLDAFWFAGTSSSTVITSDDRGDTWTLSPSELKVQTPSIGTYGGVEPVVLQLQDGRIWMLIRTQLGRFYESFSDDGAIWSHPRPSTLISSDSPAGLVRLPDGRIVLLSNRCRRFPYAHGGRHVLHAAISEDEGRTWIGHREVARDPMRHEPPPPQGDHGTAYPYPVVLDDGAVVVTTGQGKGRVVIVRIDPDWLYETSQEAGLSNALDEWSIFGCRGVETVPDPDDPGQRVLSVAKVDSEWPAAAVWNFPSSARGRLRLSLMRREGSRGALVMLTDHFSVPFDPEDALDAPFRLSLGRDGEMSAGASLDADRWHDIEMVWDQEARSCDVVLDGCKLVELAMRREGDPLSYLRLRSAVEDCEEAGILVRGVEVEIERTETPHV
jgi:hypothetical protein